MVGGIGSPLADASVLASATTRSRSARSDHRSDAKDAGGSRATGTRSDRWSDCTWGADRPCQPFANGQTFPVSSNCCALLLWRDALHRPGPHLVCGLQSLIRLTPVGLTPSTQSQTGYPSQSDFCKKKSDQRPTQV